MLEEISVCLTALYLRGLSRPINVPRRRWVQVVSCLRTADCSVSAAPDVLRKQGFWEEAILLESEELVEASVNLVSSGSILTAVHASYPVRWMERLGQAAPPALWVKGKMPTTLMIGVVGSREIQDSVREFARRVGSETVRLGYSVVSGGAAGCDRAAAAGAVDSGGIAVEILPYGVHWHIRQSRCALSICAPDEVFSTAAAMERNSLIYAASEQTVVVQARFKEGGTWIGAVDATRKKLCQLIVREDGSQASRALIALGGTPLHDPTNLQEALNNPPGQRGLFGIG